MIPYGRQQITDEDIDAVVEVLRSDFLTQGPQVTAFEQAVAAYCGASHGVAVNSATSALHLACLSLGVGPGDRVWTSPITFVASANCARYCGAEVDFVDVEPETGNLCVEALAAKLAQAKGRGALPKVVIPVHLAGLSCDMAAIGELASQYGFFVIEDASHALGGNYGGGRVGACAHSDITVFSFHPVKMITTGEGGMAVTNHQALAERMRRLSSHGIERHPEHLQGSSPGAWYYEQQELGFNYRMTDLQAALGSSQLVRLDDFVARRAQLAANYRRELEGLPLAFQAQPDGRRCSYHLFLARVEESAGKDRDTLFSELREMGVGVQVHYIPVHTQPYYRSLGFGWGQFPAAEQFYREVLSLPLHPGLSVGEQKEIIQHLGDLL